MPNSSPAPTTRAPRWFVWIGLFALAAYGVFQFQYASPTASAADQSGYLNSARLFADGKLQDEQRIPPEFGPHAKLPRHHFMPLGYVALVENPKLPPTYAPGLPLQLALFGKAFGWNAAAIIVQLINGLGALWLCYAVARELGIGATLAAAGAVVLAAFPVFLFSTIQPLSDAPAATWCLFAVWLALRARRSPHWAWSVGCGAAFAMAVYVRATNALLFPALVVFLGGNWRRLALAALGGLPWALWLGFYNHTLYGGALKSGYGPIEQTFKWIYGPRTVKHFGYWLAVLTPTVLLILPAIAAWRQRSRDLTALALWFGAITGLYTFYEVSYETWWCLRFILPAFPALILASLLGVEACLGRGRAVVAVALAAWAILCSRHWTPELHALMADEHERVYHEACDKAREIFPAESLVACFYTSGSVYFYTQFAALRWDLIDAKDFAHYAKLCRESGRPIRAMLFDGFEDQAFRERMPGDWKRLATVGRIGLWELVAARDTAAVTPAPATGTESPR